MKRPNRLSQAMRRATSKREQARRRKEREARFPKPKLVPDEGEAADRADQAEPKNTAPSGLGWHACRSQAANRFIRRVEHCEAGSAPCTPAGSR